MKAHRFPQVVIPIPGIHAGGIQGLLRYCAGHRGIQRDAGGLRRQPGQVIKQLLTQLFHMVRMRRVIHSQTADLDIVPLAAVNELH
ncbi:hypothetical protein MSIMFI_05352 [Mycobacterium simulans]|nr:hypothetical protein MSIMFI_05352 [Mycobacterium simulans]